MTLRVSVALAIASVGASMLSGMLAMPVAHADDPLAPIKAAVNGDRYRTGCSALTYNSALENAAQFYVRSDVFTPRTTENGYNGETRVFMGLGDPQAAAISGAYDGGAGGLISNCDYTDFGVGFLRVEDRYLADAVAIVFGKPATVAPPPVAAPVPDPVLTPVPATRKCPTGSPTPTVGAFETCAPPTNQVSVSFVKGLTWTVNVANTSNIAGTCTFTSNGLGGGLSNRTFDLGANGSASFQVAPPLPFATYNVVTSCRGTFDGKDVEFGHNEQKVSL